jgi:hypothetical protein
MEIAQAAHIFFYFSLNLGQSEKALRGILVVSPLSGHLKLKLPPTMFTFVIIPIISTSSQGTRNERYLSRNQAQT